MSFAALGLLPPLVSSLERAGLTEPTSVQRIGIPAILGGASVVLVARTGSGKTAAYGAAILQRLRTIEDEEGVVADPMRPRGVVVTSTRELVEQGLRDLKKLAHGARQRVRAVAGGMTEREVRVAFADPVDLLIANPTRLWTLARNGLLKLDDVRVIVVDEADTLLSPGQRPDVEKILTATGTTRQVVFVSATLPEPIRHWCLARAEHPALLQARDAHGTPTNVRVRNLKVKPHERADAAHDLLLELDGGMRGFVFANTREAADAAAVALTERGHSVLVLHGARLPKERRKTLAAFRAGEGRVLVTTELAGRGLHLEGLDFVLNYELPGRPSDYLHRVGRVGRMGAKGEVINLYTEHDRELLAEVTRLAGGGKLDTGEPLRAPHERKAEPARPPAGKRR